MQAVILAYESEADFKKRDTKTSDPAAFEAYMAPWKAYSQQLAQAGVIRGGGALEGPHAATLVSVRNGERHVEDGPYTDAKEQLGGYFIVEVASMDDAEHWAALCPTAKTGRTEAHQVPNYGSEG